MHTGAAGATPRAVYDTRRPSHSPSRAWVYVTSAAIVTSAVIIISSAIATTAVQHAMHTGAAGATPRAVYDTRRPSHSPSRAWVYVTSAAIVTSAVIITSSAIAATAMQCAAHLRAAGTKPRAVFDAHWPFDSPG